MPAAVPPAVQEFVNKLYAASDVGDGGHEAYVDLYAPDATLVMGPTTYEGQEGVRKFREDGWAKVATRKHTCLGVYPSTSNPAEVMTYGVLDYGMKDGSMKKDINWSARLVLDSAEGEPKIKFYQVYITAK